MNNILITTGDIKEDYEIISPVFFQLSNKGIFSSMYSNLVQQYSYMFKSMESHLSNNFGHRKNRPLFLRTALP